MKLVQAKKGKTYQIINFGKLNKDIVMSFYEQGIIEGELITLKLDINIKKSITLIIIDGNVYAFNKKYAKEITVEEAEEENEK